MVLYLFGLSVLILSASCQRFSSASFCPRFAALFVTVSRALEHIPYEHETYHRQKGADIERGGRHVDGELSEVQALEWF